MSEKIEEKKTILDKPNVSKILMTVSPHHAFYFFRDLGDPTGDIARSLTEFYDKLQTVDIRSVNFHFKRQDFDKWIKDVLGDEELSRKLGMIKREAYGGILRSEILRIVKERIEELKKMQIKV